MTNSWSRMPIWAWLGVALALVSALISLKARIHVEERNKMVGIAVESTWLTQVAASSGTSLSYVITMAKANGLTAVTVSEDTIGKALSSGVAKLDSEAGRRFLSLPPSYLPRGEFLLKARFPDLPPANDFMGGKRWDVSSIPDELLRACSLGLPQDVVTAAKSEGLAVIGRYSNSPGATLSFLLALFLQAQVQGVDAYLPEGDQVFGFRGNIADAAFLMSKHGMSYMSPEFAKIAGDAKLRTLMKPNLIRLHAAQQAEVDKLSPAEYKERYCKAARERGQRMLLLRSLNLGPPGIHASLNKNISMIREGLAHEGLKVGNPRPLTEPPLSGNALLFLSIAMAVGTAMVGAYVAQQLLRSGKPLFAALFVLGLGVVMTLDPSFREYSALLAALIFPCAAVICLVAEDRWNAWLGYGVAFGLSAVGGLVVAGMLNGLSYYVQTEQFPGVKAAHFVPLLAMGIALTAWRTPLKEIFNRPATWGPLLLGAVAMVMVMFMLSRTGNDNPASVSGIELKLRSLLESVMYTRPRTKEFLLGYPALFIGLMMLNAGRKSIYPEQASKYLTIAAVLLVVSLIGLTSTVNTFCHLHTPVLLSAARTTLGAGLGLLFGAAIWFTVVRRRVV